MSIQRKLRRQKELAFRRQEKKVHATIKADLRTAHPEKSEQDIEALATQAMQAGARAAQKKQGQHSTVANKIVRRGNVKLAAMVAAAAGVTLPANPNPPELSSREISPPYSSGNRRSVQVDRRRTPGGRSGMVDSRNSG